MKLLKFETKKFFKNTKNLVLIGLMFSCIVVVCIQESNQFKREREKIYTDDSYIYMELMSSAEELQKEFPELLINFQQAMDALENKLNHSNRKEWRNSLEEENIFIDNIKTIQEKVSLGFISNDILENKKKNIFFLENNIKPDNSLYGVSAMYYIRLVLSLVFSIYGYIFFLLLFFDIFSREIENKNKNWLITLPVPYKRFNKNKLILSVSFVFFLFFLLLLITFVLGLLLSTAVGNINYPMEMITVDRKIIGFPFILYFCNSFLIFLVAIYFLLLLLLSLSRVKLGSEKVLLICMIGMTALSQFTKFLKYRPSYFLVLHYVNLHDTVIEFFKQRLVLVNFYTIGIFIFILIVLTVYLFNRREN